MQNVAREMNLAETAFLHRVEDGFALRWFAPTMKVDLCGHATLASAHVLWETGELAPDVVARFHTKSGLLTATKRGDSMSSTFRSRRPIPFEAPPGLTDALGVAPRYVGKDIFDYLVEVESEQVLRALTPDFGRLREVRTRGVIVTSRATALGADSVLSGSSRPPSASTKTPRPVAAHCCLAPFWGERMHKKAFVARQLSTRGGVLKIEWSGNRVRLSGQAVTVLRGQLLV